MAKSEKNNEFTWVDNFRLEQIRKSTRSPMGAAAMSFFVMGSGQFYAGHIDRGIIMFAIELFAIFATHSVVSGGLVYTWLVSLVGPEVFITICYIASVLFILTWIFNIKDAYYLALFSAYRDWFEIERVLLIPMGVPRDQLLSSKVSSDMFEDKKKLKAALLSGNSPAIMGSMAVAGKVLASENEEHNDTSDNSEGKVIEAQVLETDSSRSTEELPKFVEVKHHREDEALEGDVLSDESQEEFPTKDLLYMNSSKWRSYAIPLAACLIVGTGAYFSSTLKNNNISPENKNIGEIPANTDINVVSLPPQSVGSSSFVTAANNSTETMKIVDGVLENAVINDVITNSSEAIEIVNAVGESANTVEESEVSVSNDGSNEAIASEEISIAEEVEADSNEQTEPISEENEKVVIIQGNKGSTVLTKSNSNEASVVVEASKVLYESSESAADEGVQLVMTDSNGRNEEKLFNPMPSARQSANEVNNAIPNVDTKILEELEKEKELENKKRLEEELKKEKAAAEKAAENSNEEVEMRYFDAIATAEALDSEDNDRSKNSEAVSNKNPNKEIAVDTDTSESAGKTAIHSGKKPQRASLMQIKAMGAKEFYKGNWEGALPYYFEVLKICRNAESFEMIGIIFEKMDKLPDAFDAYEQAYLLGMDDRRNVTRLGLIGEQIGRYDKAQKYLESAIQSNPERADVVLSYARCLDNLGEGLAAAQVLDVLRDTSSSYAVKKAAESEYKRLLKKNGVSEDKMRAKAVEKK